MTFFNQLKERYEEGKTLPQEFYTDEEIFSDEMEKIYFKHFCRISSTIDICHNVPLFK